jgi:hypothetical protein
VERRAYICLKCEPPRRDFMSATDEKEPRCPQHGKMIRQANMPYKDPRPPKPPPKPRQQRGRGARGAGGRRSRG